jgi:2-polyprenyl-3-methyl-5-hydroxy-6-metoxy-1,4-benzoquinol methylase
MTDTPVHVETGQPTTATARRGHTVDEHALRRMIEPLVHHYPQELQPDQRRDVARTAFHLSLLAAAFAPPAKVCDVGGGLGLFSLACAHLGYEVTLVDDFSDPVNERFGDGVLAVHRALGVTVVSCDAVQQPPALLPASFDAFTTFDSMEHWHHSPKRLFHALGTALRPDGLFVLGTPNCVNLRKRITVPLGLAKWSQMEDWYERPTFRGHVREPDLDDYRYIARDLELRDVRVFGRNWLGRTSPHAWIRLATSLSDPFLRFTPTLCADIYLTGRK